MELFDHQVTPWTQGPLTALYEIATCLLIEVVQEIPDEDEIVLLVPKVVCQRIPGPMYDAFTPFPLAQGSLLHVQQPLANRTQLSVILGDGGRA